MENQAIEGQTLSCKTLLFSPVYSSTGLDFPGPFIRPSGAQFFLCKHELRPFLSAVVSDSSDNAFEEGSDTSATMSFASDFSTDSDF